VKVREQTHPKFYWFDSGVARAAAGQDPDCFFWRDSAGHEVDIIIDLGSTLVPIEIKSGATISKDFFKGLKYWQNLTGTKVKSRAVLIYGGNNSVIRNKIHVYAWWNF
jgi:predicted AAA+ superfamily ATPase